MQYQHQGHQQRQQQQQQPYTVPARAAPQRDCIGRHLANRNEMHVSGSDSYALLFLADSHCILLYLSCARVIGVGDGGQEGGGARAP